MRGTQVGLVHVDHAADPGSAGRAARAAELAGELALPFRLERVDVPASRRRDESPEAAARRLRYAALEELRRELGAVRILTAHHRDDQLETVLLRLLRRAPVEGLGGIAPRRGALLRPLLEVARADIEAFLGALGLVPVADPTNLDLGLARNRLRRALLPRLRAAEPDLEAPLLALARRSAALAAALDRRFASLFNKDEDAETPRNTKTFSEGNNGGLARAALDASGAAPPPPLALQWKPLSGPGETEACRAGSREVALAAEGGGAISVDRLRSLPEALQLPALRWLLRERFGLDRLPSALSMRAFLSLARQGGPALLALPGGRTALAARRRGLRIEAQESRIPAFSYTFSIPGEVELPELGLRLRVGRSRVEPWMFRGDPRRAGFVAAPGRATVRNRRPGDRLHPIGAPGTRKLKAILIDRRVPEESRDRIPLLELAGRLAWVPGVTLDRRFAIAGEVECWLAELEPLPATESGRARTSERMAH